MHFKYHFCLMNCPTFLNCIMQKIGGFAWICHKRLDVSKLLCCRKYFVHRCVCFYVFTSLYHDFKLGVTALFGYNSIQLKYSRAKCQNPH